MVEFIVGVDRRRVEIFGEQCNEKKLSVEAHPTAQAVRGKLENRHQVAGGRLSADWLKEIAIQCGAADVGLVEMERAGLEDERKEVVSRYPWAKSLLAFVVKMNHEPIKSSARSVANAEMHHKVEEVSVIGSKIVARMQQEGVRAVNPAGGFPMEMQRYPNRIWVISHKLVAVEAGLGHMGIHRNVIHPKFGNFILLGTIILDVEASSYDRSIDFNPCLECNLCIAACPVGAVSATQEFDFSACYTHNYREFMGGFNDWVEQLAESKTAIEYRGRISESESASFWQSLAFGPNYKAAYCMAVCPAGEDVIMPFLENRKQHVEQVLRPFQKKIEQVYVVEGSDAEAHVKNRFPHKKLKHAGNALRPRSIVGLFDALPFMFQPNQSQGIDACYHFKFYGTEEYQATVIIRQQTIEVVHGMVGTADLRIEADASTWLKFLAREASLIWALITRKIKLKGSPFLLAKFGKCFPSPGPNHQRSEDWREPGIAGYQQHPFRKNDSVTGKLTTNDSNSPLSSNLKDSDEDKMENNR